VGRSLLDWKLWSFAFIYMGGAVGLSGLLFFLPLILNKGLKFSVEKAYLLSAPPPILAAIVGLATSWLADRVRRRGPFVVVGSLVAIVGLCMTGFLDSPAPRYAFPIRRGPSRSRQPADKTTRAQICRNFPGLQWFDSLHHLQHRMATEQHQGRRQASRGVRSPDHGERRWGCICVSGFPFTGEMRLRSGPMFCG
jgi:hypothetical protein